MHYFKGAIIVNDLILSIKPKLKKESASVNCSPPPESLIHSEGTTSKFGRLL